MEIFDIVDENNNVIGQADRTKCHSDKSLIHRVAHVIVVNAKGDIFLQKRAGNKDIQPGKWDTSVGGHLSRGETYLCAALRETEEELGFRPENIDFLYEYIMRSDKETEFVRTFLTFWEGNIKIEEEEISEGRFWDLKEISINLGSGIFTPNFEEEYLRYKKWQKDLTNEQNFIED